MDIHHQKEISFQYAAGQEEERKRIAELIHDDIGSKLNVLTLWINNEETWNDPRSKEVISTQIPALIDSAREISHALYPTILEKFGLLLTLEGLVSNIEGSLSVQLVCNHNYNPRPIAIEIQIYRIVQEFLSNVIKHANASEMNILIRDSKKGLTIVLSDNGDGFDADLKSNGMGLRNVESRVNSISAFSVWKNKADSGSYLLIILPK